MKTERTRVVLATRNKGKLGELKAMLEGFVEEVLCPDDFPSVGEIAETGATFEENALIKAQALCQATGLVCISDDSGLEVDALGGAPGVHSARYSGEGAADAANNAKLLHDLRGVEAEKRTARFRTAVIAMAPGGKYVRADGIWEGRIGFEPKGENGFGYDPVFIDLASGLTAAEMDADSKNKSSHRGKALAELMKLWPDFIRNL